MDEALKRLSEDPSSLFVKWVEKPPRVMAKRFCRPHWWQRLGFWFLFLFLTIAIDVIAVASIVTVVGFVVLVCAEILIRIHWAWSMVIMLEAKARSRFLIAPAVIVAFVLPHLVLPFILLSDKSPRREGEKAIDSWLDRHSGRSAA